GGQVGRLRQLEIAATSLVRDLPQSPVRAGALAIHDTFQPNRVHHHLFGARAVDHRAELGGLAVFVHAVGEDQNDATAFDPLQLVHARRDRIPQAGTVAVVEILDGGNQLVALVGKAGADLDL